MFWTRVAGALVPSYVLSSSVYPTLSVADSVNLWLKCAPILWTSKLPMGLRDKSCLRVVYPAMKVECLAVNILNSALPRIETLALDDLESTSGAASTAPSNEPVTSGSSGRGARKSRIE